MSSGLSLLATDSTSVVSSGVLLPPSEQVGVVSPSDVSTSESYAPRNHRVDSKEALDDDNPMTRQRSFSNASDDGNDASVYNIRGGTTGGARGMGGDDDEDSEDDLDRGHHTIAEEHNHNQTEEKSVSSSNQKMLRSQPSSKISNGTSGESSEFSRTRTTSEISAGSSSGNVMMKIDGMGRLVATQRNLSMNESKESVKQYNERLMKWMSMIRHLDRYITYEKNSDKIHQVGSKFKSRLYKGVPDAVRSTVYLKLLEVDLHKREKGEKMFEELNQKKKIGTGPFDEIIRRDLHRTNPEHVMFMNKEGAGQEALFRVLRAYSLYDEELGYCQGMGFFVSVMLTYVPEEEAFWMLVGLFQKHAFIRDFYLPSMIGLRKSFFVFSKLLQSSMPKLSKHLEKNDFSAPIYASRWFGTLCADFPIEITLRIWDILVLDGPKILYQVGLAIMKKCKKELKNASFEEFGSILREAQRTIDTDELIQEALKFNVRQKDIDTYGKKFDEIESKLVKKG
jgi:hypothetical protein